MKTTDDPVRRSCPACLLALLVACAPSNPRDTGDGDTASDASLPASCTPGTTVCLGNEAHVCDARGVPGPGETCPEACAPGLGCAACVPGTGECHGDEAWRCLPDGSGHSRETCDPLQGMVCDADTGRCTGPCSPLALGESYIGCEYFPTVTGNMVSNDYHFAVAVSNTSDQMAAVTVEGGALAGPLTFSVAAGAVQVQELPWQLDLKLVSGDTLEANARPTAGALVTAGGAYRLRSTVPVTVYQFNPLEYKLAGAGTGASYSNDASLLLPTNVWRGDYRVASWQSINGANPAELAVTAQRDGTQVTITSKAATKAVGALPGFEVDVARTVTLDAGGVLELVSLDGDFTGTQVTADRPIQVIGGHFCAKVPEPVPYCDHLEESMFPVGTLGRRYLVSAPALPSMPAGKVQVVRIVATAPDTTLTYTPAQPGAPMSIAAAGDFVELAGSKASFLVEANQKILVAQYMEGQEAGGGAGDPAMALAVPVEQFRTDYLFHAPINYDTNYGDVIAPVEAVVSLDGAPLTFTPIGSTGYGLARVQLTAGPGGDGNHRATGDRPFGISVYGYGTYTSYWYPGGLDLREIVID